jgi:deoxyribonuclease-4
MPGTMPTHAADSRQPAGVASIRRSTEPPLPALPGARRLGVHLPLAGGMVRAVERAHAIGAEALQVFADNPTAWKRRADPPAELDDFRSRAAELGIGPIVVHASYLVNLGGPVDELFERSVELLAHEMAIAPGYGADFVNVHVGSHKGTGLDAGLARAAEGVRRVIDSRAGHPRGPLLVLENSAGGGGGFGATVDELARLLDAAAALGVPAGELAICLDTAHLWSAGHDLATAEGVDAVLAEFDARIGLERLVLIHLNDSKVGRGSRIDRHEHLGAGEMAPGEGLARLLVHPRLAHVAYILETPGMDAGYDAVNLARARALAAGRPLDPLPPEAFDLPGSRSRTPARP